ncbi:hypothetical protein [Rhodanobacter sp. DHG33]|uniref:hypothetical protein n=1 Tax=Rhodanobacter sp. DHG33 TaxID=2775921 RepID=UPI00177B7C7E|nr:hypothetical protein [Rhodanobacter sp. DHG33]MBD8898582.1 hypothetical protein [Rhodanobacter sp. DHG33]
MTGMQKLGTARCFIVMPLLLLSFTLSSSFWMFLAPVILPWCMYIAYNHGRNSHSLQAVNGFQQAAIKPVFLGMTTKLWYIAGAVAGVVMIVGIMVTYPDDSSAPATTALYFAVFCSFFCCSFLTRAGLRMGWSSVIECDPGTDAAQVVRLVNPDAVKRQQLIYTLAGLVVLLGALSSLSRTYPLWANGSGSSSALTSDEEGLRNALGN